MSVLKTILSISLLATLQCQETPFPSSQLQVRNYNPHAYLQPSKGFLVNNLVGGLDDIATVNQKHERLFSIHSRGPIKFPPNEGEELRELQQEEQARRLLAGIAAQQSLSHPYEQLSLKTGVRDLKLQRFVGPDQHVLAPAYVALSQHARKVLNNKFQQKPLGSDDFYDQDQINNVDQDFEDYNGIDGNDNSDEISASASNYKKKNFKFSYAVRDQESGDDFSHTQKQENGAVEGSYKVQLPDGRTQIVKYIADSNGYRADVSYQDKNGDIVSTQSPASYQHGSAYQQVQSTPGTYLEKPSISYYKKAVPTSPLYLVSTPYPPRQHYQDINVQPRQPIVSQASIAPVVHVHHRGGSRQNQENHENYYGLQGNQIVGYYGQPSTQNPYINSDY